MVQNGININEVLKFEVMQEWRLDDTSKINHHSASFLQHFALHLTVKGHSTNLTHQVKKGALLCQ